MTRSSGHCAVCNMRIVRLDGVWQHWTPAEYDHEAEPKEDS